MGICLFVLSNILLTAACLCISFRFFREKSVELTLLGGLVLFPVLILLIVLGLGSFGFLGRYPVALTACIIGIGVVGFECCANRQSLIKRCRYLVTVGLVMVVIGVAGGYLAGRLVFAGTGFNTDDLSYHGPMVAHWVRAGSVWAGPFNYHYYYPGNGEVMSLWWVLPFESDGFAFLSGFYWLFMLAIAIFVLAGRLELGNWFRILAPLAILGSNVMLSQVNHTFCAVDLGASAMVLASLAFILFRNEQREGGGAEAVFAGLACGFAIGCKIPFAIAGMVFFLWLLFSRREVTGARSRFRQGMLFGLAALLTGSYWYFRNMYLTGNPVFPGELGPFAGPLTSEIRRQTTILGQLIKHNFSRDVLTYAIGRVTSWPGSLFVICACGYGAGVVHCFRASKSAHRGAVILLVVTGVVMFCTFLIAPFAGSYNGPDSPTVISLRFIITAYVLGIVLFGLLADVRHYAKWFWRLLFAAAVLWAFAKMPESLNVVFGSVLVLLAVLSGRLAGFVRCRENVTLTCCCLVSGGLIGLGFCYPIHQSLTDQRIFETSYDVELAESPWKFLETLPDGAAISVGSSGFRYYPLFGRKFQFEPRPIDLDGAVYRRLHEKYAEAPQEVLWWPENRPPRTGDELIENAKRNGAEYWLLIKKWDKAGQFGEDVRSRYSGNVVRETEEFILWKL